MSERRFGMVDMKRLEGDGGRDGEEGRGWSPTRGRRGTRESRRAWLRTLPLTDRSLIVLGAGMSGGWRRWLAGTPTPLAAGISGAAYGGREVL